MRFFLLLSLSVSLALGGCGDDSGSDDAGLDASTADDAGQDGGNPDAGEDAAVTDGGSDAGVDAGPVDAGQPVPVPAFMLLGHLGRTAISCDDGRSWTADRSANDDGRCWAEDGGIECDHEANAGRGLLALEEGFMRTLGWGPPGGVERSQDGVVWERTLDETTFAGLASDGSVILTGSRFPYRSLDGGETWESLGDTGFTEWNVRSVGWAPYGGGRFFLMADGPEVRLSTDQGVTWRAPSSPPAACSGELAYGNDVIVLVNTSGLACSSTDAGESWVETSIGAEVEGPPLFHDGSFYAWGRGQLFTSTDGVSWTTQATSPSNLMFAGVAVSETTGTFVGIDGSWGDWYETQLAYRSTDGVTWETLDSSAYTGGHPIRWLASGTVMSSAEGCPAP